MSPEPPPIRRHRRLFWAALVLALAVCVGGGVSAYAGYAATAGPDGAVRGYFAALARSDAAAALAFGDIPAGPRTLLTGTVLRSQQRLAHIRDVHVTSVDRAGDSARVQVRYELAYADYNQSVSDSVRVNRRGGSWHLAASAVAVRLGLIQAQDRASLAGIAVPSDPILLFPGAIPLRFDTPYLQLAQDSRNVQLNSSGQQDLNVEISRTGVTAVTDALKSLLPACLTGAPTAAPTCPRPSIRSVPDSLRGSMTGPLLPTITIAPGAAGTIDVQAHVKVVGTYRVLTYNNVAVTRHGTVTLPLHATSFATNHISLTWLDDES